jgi:uncharacterized membrane-anchored protein
MNKKEEEIQRKLAELETTVLKEQTDMVTASHLTSTGMSASGSATGKGQAVTGHDQGLSTRSDGAYFGGIGLILLGLILVFQHVRVGSGLMAMLGMGSGGFAILFLPLMIGIGMMFYDSKNKWGWIITSLSCLFLILATMATLTITFPGVNLLTMIVMFLPFALGGALLVKGLGGAKGVEQAVKAQLPKKEG